LSALDSKKVLDGTDFRVLLQHTDYLDYQRYVGIRPDIVVCDASRSVAAIADVKYKRPSTDKLSPNDVYQAVAYATRYGLDRVALIFAEPPPSDRVARRRHYGSPLIGRPISHPT